MPPAARSRLALDTIVPQIGTICQGYKDVLLRCQFACLLLGIGAQLALSHRGRFLVAYAKHPEGKINLLRMYELEKDASEWEVREVWPERFNRGEFDENIRSSAEPRSPRPALLVYSGQSFDVAGANELEGALRAHVRRAGGHIQCRHETLAHKINYYCLAPGGKCTFSVILDVSPRSEGFCNIERMFLEHSCLFRPKAIPGDLAKAMSWFPFLTFAPSIYKESSNPTPKSESPEVHSVEEDIEYLDAADPTNTDVKQSTLSSEDHGDSQGSQDQVAPPEQAERLHERGRNPSPPSALDRKRRASSPLAQAQSQRYHSQQRDTRNRLKQRTDAVEVAASPSSRALPLTTTPSASQRPLSIERTPNVQAPEQGCSRSHSVASNVFDNAALRRAAASTSASSSALSGQQTPPAHVSQREENIVPLVADQPLAPPHPSPTPSDGNVPSPSTSRSPSPIHVEEMPDLQVKEEEEEIAPRVATPLQARLRASTAPPLANIPSASRSPSRSPSPMTVEETPDVQVDEEEEEIDPPVATPLQTVLRPSPTPPFENVASTSRSTISAEAELATALETRAGEGRRDCFDTLARRHADMPSPISILAAGAFNFKVLLQAFRQDPDDLMRDLKREGLLLGQRTALKTILKDE